MDGFLGANYTSRGSLFDANGDRIATEPNQTSRNDTDTLDINGRLNFNLTDTQSLVLVRSIIRISRILVIYLIMDRTIPLLKGHSLNEPSRGWN